MKYFWVTSASDFRKIIKEEKKRTVGDQAFTPNLYENFRTKTDLKTGQKATINQTELFIWFSEGAFEADALPSSDKQNQSGLLQNQQVLSSEFWVVRGLLSFKLSRAERYIRFDGFW